jgi:S-adenosylmethionine decarboxylase
MTFGIHLTIDGYDGNKDKLNDKDLVLSFLSELPRSLKMNTLADPVVYFAPGNDKKDPGGWSGFVVIQESHISIHTFPGRKFLSADVYTCQDELDKDLVIKFITEKFELKDTEVNLINRGTKYPDSNI